ncbi:MAG: amidohydrolase family protein [Spirochaetes bacterium]|jgi:cytosine/adenosine deaminase-related metal-dependent hydrolase|nr:amidohydrolase family protein [Spirochaetota bacterium]
MKKWSITGVSVLTPEKSIGRASVVINGERIEGVVKGKSSQPVSVSLENTVLLPGLINGHDHLLGTYYPKIGNGPYENWLPWDNDLKSAPLYQERQQIENRDLYILGAYRNLVSGVATVSDHIPHFVAEPYYDLLPMKAIRNYSLAHSITSFALKWGEEIDKEYKKALDGDMPFVTHCSEGFDEETARDVITLDRKGGLGDHSVLVHGLAFSESDMKLIKQRGASVVWCADSNMYMYNETADVKMLLDMGINVCIGTDSPASGGLNLLYELKYDKALYEEIYGEELPDSTIVKMVTVNPAKAFRLKKAGQIAEGYRADLIAVTDRGGSPYSSVVNAEMKDIRLVVIDGRPVYADAEYSFVFDSLKVDYQRIRLGGTDKVIIGDPVGLLRRISRAVGFKKEFPFLPVSFDV